MEAPTAQAVTRSVAAACPPSQATSRAQCAQNLSSFQHAQGVLNGRETRQAARAESAASPSETRRLLPAASATSLTPAADAADADGSVASAFVAAAGDRAAAAEVPPGLPSLAQQQRTRQDVRQKKKAWFGGLDAHCQKSRTAFV